MFAYLLIAIELVILSGVFYHVFIREPKPYQVGSSGLWGSYEGGGMHFSQAEVDTLILEYKQNAETQILMDCRVPRFANSQMMPGINPESGNGSSKGGGTHLPSDSGWNSLYNSNSPEEKRRKAEQYGWVAQADVQPGNSFMGLLTAALYWFENLSVKLP
jgi:hypothetical protein